MRELDEELPYFTYATYFMALGLFSCTSVLVFLVALATN